MVLQSIRDYCDRADREKNTFYIDREVGRQKK